ncbi:MAG: HIT domain-containing protein [Nanoarchaeota archaeon]|nr:HIT domain-containing protein [Nanoarchaeota archaeon]MBU1622203.1 HIT domain-containing protein [Nanoarchaeota archaeon]MBU1974534.1 HIT domain-containing protein [Nanoarchaeota archaeon]
MKCDYCEMRNTEILYEDDEVVVAIKDTALTPGQITVFPKEHHTILEMVPDSILRKCSLIANKVSIAIFESMGCQGTNIIAQNGISAGQLVPHFALEVIPRRENDDLNFQWQPKKLMEDEMDAAFNSLKEAASDIYVDENQKKRKSTVKLQDQENQMIVEKEGKDNYLLKSIKRLP